MIFKGCSPDHLPPSECAPGNILIFCFVMQMNAQDFGHYHISEQRILTQVGAYAHTCHSLYCSCTQNVYVGEDSDQKLDL